MAVAFIALGVLVSGCLQSPNRARTADGEDVEYESPQAQKYCQFGDSFVKALLDEQYDTAYEMCCAALRARVSRDEFENRWKADNATYGRTLSVDPFVDCTTDAAILAGPNHVKGSGDSLEDGFNRLEAAIYVGDTPDDVAIELRRAAMQTAMNQDPKSIPSLVEEYGEDLDEIDAECFIQLVVVEENGALKVGHFWRRWPNMLD